jgi:ferric-dicitrate binding protein FerR (iron transport regulator)
MKKKDLISKWLNFNLNDEELEAFNELDASSSYHRIDRAAKLFKAPDFDSDASYKRLKTKLGSQKKAPGIYSYISAVAAVLVVAFGLFYILNLSPNTEYVAENSAKTEFLLPDSSEVILNAGSVISYSEKDWSKNRSLKLAGEAYFKVAKGEKFTVQTNQGRVSVLGTQFKVNDRDGYFEVSCYEGLVLVSHQGKEVELSAGYTYKAFGDIIVHEATALSKPSWLDNKSTFISVPFNQVVSELERQFDIEISGDATDSATLFTGSFSNEKLETALQAITIPLNLSYSINGKNVVFKIDQR